LPKQKNLRLEFEKKGLNIEEYKVELEMKMHLKGVHGKGFGDLPGKWNDRWTDFFENFKSIGRDPTPHEIMQYLQQLMKEYKIYEYGINLQVNYNIQY